MVTRVRTIDFLPDIFKTKTNEQFLAATLDQLTQQPDTTRIQGYIGSKFGYGIGVNDKYLVEPTKTRRDYQLEPSVVFKKKDTNTAVDLITYPGLIDALKIQDSITDNNNNLFKNQFYSWDSFADLDKLINYSQYYWLPKGPDAVTVTNVTLYTKLNYEVTDTPIGFTFTTEFEQTGVNTEITLVRGGTYNFTVDQNSAFWIQTEPGVTGKSKFRENISTREVFGVTFNGSKTGTVTFNVPLADAQDKYNYPGNFNIDLATTLKWEDINGARLTDLGNKLDGVYDLRDKTLLFYGYQPGSLGTVSKFYGQEQELYEETVLSEINKHYYRIRYLGDPDNYVIQLEEAGLLPDNTNLTIRYGTQFLGRQFVKTSQSEILFIPNLTAGLDTLYYQDGNNPDKVGVIRLVDNTNVDVIDITQILGKKEYTSPNNIKFTNGLKVQFLGNIFPTSYSSGQYYVEGVGTSIQLISTDEFDVPEPFSESLQTPFDITPYDVFSYSETYFIPVNPDYITIARNSLDKNSWSRSNRWFHVDVLNTSIANNISSPISSEALSNERYRAKRPIIEFYPNLRLFNSGTASKADTDFINFSVTDAFNQVAGQPLFYPDCKVYTAYTAILPNVSSALNAIISVPTSDITGKFAVGQFVNDSAGVLPESTVISGIVVNGANTELTVEFPLTTTFTSMASVSLVANPTSNDGFLLFDGAKIIFANDTNLDVRNKIFIANFNKVSSTGQNVITLTPVENTSVKPDEQTVILKGSTSGGKTYWFDGSNWNLAQQKTRINQPPLFDVFDSNGVSFGDTDFYTSSTFEGCTLFQYGIGTGVDDSILNFPIRYSSSNNLGDISFDVTLNTQTFEYLLNSLSTLVQVNTGYVYNYTDRVNYERMIGWQTAVEESFQYQVFEKTYTGTPSEPYFVCDVKAKDQITTKYPIAVVYVDNERIASSKYTLTTTSNTTTITLTETPLVGTPVVIMLYSNQVSQEGYYQIPTNLDHNPFNAEITQINLGDVRGHYKSICNNAPNFEGQAFGPNNYRDLGNLVPYGTRIIQNSASLVSCSAFIRNNNNNFFDALSFNASEYIKFKTLLINTLINNEYTNNQPPAFILDDALDKITSTKVENNPFFWSDMLPSKNAYITNTYTFRTDLSTSFYPLSRVYDFATANYYGVLVYLTRRINGQLEQIQLVKGVDYEVSSTEKNLTITADLVAGDVITIKEYDQTYGSYVPNTPTKIGLYPSFIPAVVLDNTYITPTYFIQGHDGSYNKLYGQYVNGVLEDYRDRVLLEFETRIYNNLKLSNAIPIAYDEIVPGQFRDVGYSFADFNRIYSIQFLNWIGTNRIDYKDHYYNSTNSLTYNYTGSKYKFNKKTVEQGSWRGIFMWLYDTVNPGEKPWEMLGLSNKPTWWDSHYGPAPYSSDNTILWEDIRDGKVWNNGDPYINPNRVRPNLFDILPVDSQGNQLSPFEFAISGYDTNRFSNPWVLGELGPAEFSYRKSSNWPFDLVRLMALLKPAKFFALGIDVDSYKYNAEFNQYLFNNRYRNYLSLVPVYGNGTAVNSYINWIVDYLYLFGVDGNTTVKTLIENLDVRLAYRLAGFSDKDLVNFYVEKGTPSSKNNSLMIPDDSYSILLYDNQPTTSIIYSSVIIQKTTNGYRVYGNSQNKVYFTAQVPSLNGVYDTITVNGKKLLVPKNYYDKTVFIPYGHEFENIQDLAIFLRGYGLYLASQGMNFADIENGVELTWDQMIAEVFYWANTGWSNGSTLNVNPAARNLSVSKESQVVQPLTITKENFVLNQNLVPILLSDLSITRIGTEFNIKTLNQGDAIAFFRANLSSIEHVVVFDNVTVFNDVIYNLPTGLRQQRIYVKGTKTAEWNGTVNAAGFLMNQDNILEWQPNTKYSKGTIVKFKNEFYMANEVTILPSTTFDYNQWLKTSYDDIQKGLLPNPSTRAYEATLYYNSNNPNLENDGDLLSFSLIGYRPREYFASANFDDATQVNLYKNMIGSKGTVDSVTKLQGINLQQNNLNYDVFENWAIKTTEFGGLLNSNYADFTLNESLLTGNPSILGIIQNQNIQGIQQAIPTYNVKNYGRPITSSNILPQLTQQTPDVLPSAGYANLDDMVAVGYTLNDLPDATINEVYKNDYLYIADKDSTWNVYTPLSTGAQVIEVINNLNNTITIVFDKPHGLLVNQIVGVVSFDTRVDGYHLIDSIASLTSIIVTFTLDPIVTNIVGQGLSYLLQSQRVVSGRDIVNLPLLNAEWTQNKVWVDENKNGNWTVYEKTNNYNYELIPNNNPLTTKFGTSVIYIPEVGYFIGDPGQGKVYHYAYGAQGFYVKNTISFAGATNFGTAMARSQDLLVITNPGNIISQIYIFKIPTADNINSVTLQQVITFGGNIGSSLDISGDSNLLYLGSPDNNIVVPFQRDRVLTYTVPSNTVPPGPALVLSGATTINSNYFECAGNVTARIAEGQRVSFLTSYTDTGAVLAAPLAELTTYFVVTGDQRSVLVYGDQVSFNNTGVSSTQLFTVGAKGYDSLTNTTTFFTIEYMPVGISVGTGTKVYKVEFYDGPVNTVITSTYNSTTNTTRFYVLENVEYTAPSGSYIYLANDNFTIAGFLTSPLTATGDKFGFSLATNYDGSKLFVGAPYANYSSTLADTGIVYVWDRLIESFEVQYDQQPYQAYLIVLPFNPTNQTRVYVNGKLLQSNKYVVILNGILFGNIGLLAGDIIEVSSLNFVNTSQLYSQDNPSDLRTGELFGYSVSTNRYGSEVVVGAPYDVSNDSMKEGSVVRFTNAGKRFGNLTGVIGTNLIEPTYLLLNGYIVNAFNTVPLTSTISTGSTSCTLPISAVVALPSAGVLEFVQATTGIKRTIAYSAKNNNTGVVTFAVVWPYAETMTPADTNVNVPLGNAANVANAINAANITNVRAFATSDNRLQIRLLKAELGQVNNKLNISVFNGNYLFQLGFIDYVKSQVIQDPHPQTKTLFGYAVKFNEADSFVVGAPANTRYLNTTFDFTNDNNKNDTVFDNAFTTFEERATNAGSVYMYDFIPGYQESLTNISNFVYAQSCNDTDLNYGAEPMYGASLAFNDGVVLAGAPNFNVDGIKGRVVSYTNTTGRANWHVYRESDPIVDVHKIQKAQLYDNVTNENLISLDYIDPVQGKLLGTVRENLDFISSSDPAGYNSPEFKSLGKVWGPTQIGKLWFDTTNTRFLNYHQNDVVYNSKYWGSVFPGSDVAVYSWIKSDVTPAFYGGPGTPYDLTKYAIVLETDSNNNLVPRYFYWVRNTNILFVETEKTLSDTILEQYISNPINSGIAWMAPLRPDAYAFVNAQDYINDISTNLHLGFKQGSNDNPAHEEFQLIREDFADDFLTGFPNREKGYNQPTALYDRYLDSFSGTDETGALVPDPFLPKLVQTGIYVRPRQSMFVNRFNALKNYLQYANSIIAQYPINEFSNITYLYTQGQYFNTQNYWKNIYWWATGYNDATRAALEVSKYSDLLTLTPNEGLIVGVAANADGNREVYRYESNNWVRIGVQNGTIEFLSTLWDYQTNKIGFGDNFFDSTPYDEYPSVETRFIIRALNEQIFVGPLFEFRNKALILMFNYIQAENIESQNYMPWLNKTSLIDVNYTVRELTRNQKFQRDNQSLLEGYINEMKPYHVVIKDFYLKYTKTDVYQGDLTDFDLPAVWNEEQGKFISPQLVFAPGNNGPYKYSSNNSIWQEQTFNNWYNSFGTNIEVIPGEQVGILAKYVGTIDQEIHLENARGMPETGIIKINEEIISYTNVDRLNQILGGISRGVNNSVVSPHFAGTDVFMDLPGIVILYPGKFYSTTPEVTAFVDTTLYPGPKKNAVLGAIVSNGKILGVNVIDSGDGYVVEPEIIFAPSFETRAEIGDINFLDYSIQVQTTILETGDLVYFEGISSNGKTIVPNGFYYVNIIPIITTFAVSNASIISLHYSLEDSLSRTNKVQFVSPTLIPADYQQSISIRARAIPSMGNQKIRGITTTLKYDRTSYQSRVQQWTPGNYYSSPYISIGNDASSVAKLYTSTVTENISGIVFPSSGSGALFDIYNIVLGGNYEADVILAGLNYNANDTIVIRGSQLGGSGSVTVNGTISSGSPIINVTSTSWITPGTDYYIYGQGIPYGAKVISYVANTSITLNVNATQSVSTTLFASEQVTYQGAMTAGDLVVLMSNTSDISVGDYVSGYGITYGTEVVSINPNVSVTLSEEPTVTGTYQLKFGSEINNDCIITVLSVNLDGAIETIRVSGLAPEPSLASLQGAVLPVTNVSSTVDGKAVVTVDYTPSGLKPGQVNGSHMFFYKKPTLSNSGIYIYDDSAAGGAIIRISKPNFAIENINETYQIYLIDPGSIYSSGDTILIKGSLLDGQDNINDAIITISVVNIDGSIISLSVNGVCQSNSDRFYVKAISDTELEIFSNPPMTIPVDYTSFVSVWTGAPGEDFGYLPEPIGSNYSYSYNVSSIVSYAGIIWQCIDANNDTEFDPTKWFPLMSSDININALDRIEAYYQPTVDMPGKDAQQLVNNITYPNNVYLGNAFAPEDQFALDFILKDQSFYPADANVKDVVFNGTTYVAACDASDGSLILTRNVITGTWSSVRISDTTLGITSLTYNNGLYVLTTETVSQPLLISFDSTNWVTLGSKSGLYDNLSYDMGTYDFGTITINANGALTNSLSINNLYFAVGNGILRSSDGIIWNNVYKFPSVNLSNTLNDIAYVDIPGYFGYIAVGLGSEITSGEGTAAPTISPVSRILRSIDGVTSWTTQTPALSSNGLNGIASNNSVVVVVGENSTIYRSTNASNWVLSTVIGGTIANINSVTFGNGVFVAVGDKTGSAATDPGFIITSSNNGSTWTEISSQFITTNNLNSVYFAGGYFYATGENDTIIRSTNGVNWSDASNIQIDDPYYTVKGNDFQYGYGPEELVAGVVTDTLSMFVTSAPGAYWDLDNTTYPYWYKNTGFNMKTVVAKPINNKVSFNGIIINPVTLSVFIVDDITKTGRRIYTDLSTNTSVINTNNPTGYTIQWIDETITIEGAALAANESIMIELYEIGNGKELERGNSKLVPLQIDPDTGNSMILFSRSYEVLINDPLVYINGIKQQYNVDYYVTFTTDNAMKLVFNAIYDNNVDYIVYSIVGDATTIYNTTQYQYSLPETQIFVESGTTPITTIALSSDITIGDNEDNAIVEVNGLRLIPTTDYTFDTVNNELDLVTGVTNTDVVAITTYNDTSRQWPVTQSYTGVKVTPISFVNNAQTPVVISFESDPVFVNGDQIKLNGVLGSTELNGQSYYVGNKSTVDGYHYSLYTDSGLTTPLNGTNVSNYVSSGYAALVSDNIVVPFPTVPVGKDPMTYTDNTKVWVTIDGERLNPADVTFIGETNQLFILTPVSSSSTILVTAFVSGASPNPTMYNNNVNKYSDGSVYRTNPEDGSWLTQEFKIGDTEMKFFNVANLVNTIEQNVIVLEDAGTKFAYLEIDLNSVKEVQIYNDTAITPISNTLYSLSLVNGRPAVTFTNGVSAGDMLLVTLVVGSIVEINGERIRFENIDLQENTISGLTRGIQGTIVRPVHPEYSMGYGINDARKVKNYSETWNSDNITINGDPLQISTTATAVFLQSNQIS